MMNTNTDISDKKEVTGLLENTGTEKLEKFVVEYASQNPEFKEALFNYINPFEPQHSKQEYLEIAQSYFEIDIIPGGGLGQQLFHAAHKTELALDSLLKKANYLKSMHNYREATYILQSMIETIPRCYEKVDDSGGGIGDTFKQAVSELQEIIESEKEGYWISTKEALYKLVGNRLENITAQVPEVGKGIGSISEDKNGNLYFVFDQHYLHIYDGKEITEFEKPEDNKGPVVYQIYRDQMDRLWFLGFGGAYRLENGKFLNITKHGPW